MLYMNDSNREFKENIFIKTKICNEVIKEATEKHFETGLLLITKVDKSFSNI